MNTTVTSLDNPAKAKQRHSNSSQQHAPAAGPATAPNLSYKLSAAANSDGSMRVGAGEGPPPLLESGVGTTVGTAVTQRPAR